MPKSSCANRLRLWRFNTGKLSFSDSHPRARTPLSGEGRTSASFRPFIGGGHIHGGQRSDACSQATFRLRNRRGRRVYP